MIFKRIESFSDFTLALRQAGFSLAGDKDEGIFSLSAYFSEDIVWHTDQAETDPWQWRVRVSTDCDDIAYGKFFFKKHGYICRNWLPAFMKLRRPLDLEELYHQGSISSEARQIHRLLNEHGSLPLHELKSLCGIQGKEDGKAFEKAIDELQMLLYICMCGSQQKISQKGEPYGWPSAVYGLPETLFGEALLDETESLQTEEARSRILERIHELNPQANAKAIARFLRA